MKENYSRTEVNEEEQSEEARLAKMRVAFEELMKRKPVAMFLIVDAGDNIGSAAIGSPIDLLALYTVAGGQIGNLLKKIPAPGTNG